MTITTPPPETRRRRLRRGDASTRADEAEGTTATGRRAASAKTSATKAKATPREKTDGTPRGKPAPSGARPRVKGAGSAGGKTTGTGATATKAAGARTATKRPATRTEKARTARTRTEPTRAPARRPAGTRPPRQVPRRTAPPRARAPFVLLVVGLLGGALVSLLLLNTVLAQDAFTLSELQRDNRQLAERKQALQADIARESDPRVLHQKARSLGMVDPQGTAFIDARTGRVTEVGSPPQGVSDEAVAAAAAGAVTGAPGALVPPAVGTAPRQNTRKAAPGQGVARKTAAPREGGGTR
ncbi:MAG: hypothetical protein ACJ72W_16715 [Actinoallomurus sp.]